MRCHRLSVSCCRWRSPTRSSSTARPPCGPPAASRPPTRSAHCRAPSRSPKHGLAAAVAELAPGVTEQALTGVMLEAMAAGGVSTSATQDGAWITPREQSWRVGRRDRRIADGDLVAFASGALANGYVGEVGRTWPVGDVKGADALYGRSNATVGQAGCRMSARGAGQRPVRRLRSGRRIAAPDAGRARARARVRSAGDLTGPGEDVGRANAWTRARCWPSRPTCGKQASVRCSAAMPCSITDTGAEVLTASPSPAQAAAGIS